MYYSNPAVIKNDLLRVLKFPGDTGDTVEREATVFQIGYTTVFFHFGSIFKQCDVLTWRFIRKVDFK
jgi:hypothetical protein